MFSALPRHMHTQKWAWIHVHPPPFLEGCVGFFSYSQHSGWRPSAQQALKTHRCSLAMDSNESLHTGKLAGPAHLCVFQIPHVAPQHCLSGYLMERISCPTAVPHCLPLHSASYSPFSSSWLPQMHLCLSGPGLFPNFAEDFPDCTFLSSTFTEPGFWALAVLHRPLASLPVTLGGKKCTAALPQTTCCNNFAFCNDA